MSTTIESLYGKQLKVSNYDSDGQVELKPEGDSGRNYKVAELLAALKSEGLLPEQHGELVINLPEAKYDPLYLTYRAGGFVVDHEKPEVLRRKAAAHLAVAKLIEGEDNLAAIRNRALTKRRDDLAREITPYAGTPPTYAVFDRDIRAFIDKVIGLEDRLAEASN